MLVGAISLLLVSEGVYQNVLHVERIVAQQSTEASRRQRREVVAEHPLASVEKRHAEQELVKRERATCTK